MKKILALITICLFFFGSHSEAGAVKKILYSVKESTARISLLKGERIRQTFKCQPGLGGVDVKLSGSSQNSFIFRIGPVDAEKTNLVDLPADNWYFENEFDNVSFANRVVYPIGFPIIEDCQQDNWLFEVESLNTEQPLNVFYNQNNAYPDGEMLVFIISSGDEKFETKPNNDTTFRLTADEPFAEQIKNDLMAELSMKIYQQRCFWIVYLVVLAVVAGLLHKSYTLSKSK